MPTERGALQVATYGGDKSVPNAMNNIIGLAITEAEEDNKRELVKELRELTNADVEDLRSKFLSKRRRAPSASAPALGPRPSIGTVATPRSSLSSSFRPVVGIHPPAPRPQPRETLQSQPEPEEIPRVPLSPTDEMWETFERPDARISVGTKVMQFLRYRVRISIHCIARGEKLAETDA